MTPSRKSKRHLGRLAAEAWGLTILGGAMCGLVSFGVATMLLFFVSMPVGAALGVVVGAPMAAAISLVVARGPSSPPDTARFERTLSIVGAAVAVLISSPILIAAGVAAVDSWGMLDPSPRHHTVALGLGYSANAAFAVAAVAGIGWCFGWSLARAHLKRVGIALGSDQLGTDTTISPELRRPRLSLPARRR